jgi:hypothetical protein
MSAGAAHAAAELLPWLPYSTDEATSGASPRQVLRSGDSAQFRITSISKGLKANLQLSGSIAYSCFGGSVACLK